MKHDTTVLVAALILATAGCDATRDETTGVNEGNAPGHAADATQPGNHDKDQPMPALKPPSPDSVLYFIYKRDGDGAFSYEVDGGATVSFWTGHAFDFKGRHYYTGFANKTEGQEPDGDAGMMEPGHVAISQATFVREDKAGEPGWTPVDTDGYVGEFGSNDRADEIDDSRKPQSHASEDGRMLLAIPTRRFMNGIASASYALFVFDPDNVDQLEHRSWGYLGSVAAGEDNAAACDGGAVMPCAASAGTLSFLAETDAGLPRLQVALSGEAIAGPGEVRPLGPADALTYAFDANTGTYGP